MMAGIASAPELITPRGRIPTSFAAYVLYVQDLISFPCVEPVLAESPPPRKIRVKRLVVVEGPLKILKKPTSL